jgi:hypothetical protein
MVTLTAKWFNQIYWFAFLDWGRCWEVMNIVGWRGWLGGVIGDMRL